MENPAKWYFDEWGCGQLHLQTYLLFFKYL